jgi:phosphatidate cytidylyltransferase
MHEFFSMTLERRSERFAVLLFGAGAMLLFYWLPARYSPGLVAFLAAFFSVFLYYLFSFGRIETVAARAALAFTGIIYCGLFLTSMAVLKRDLGTHGSYVLLMVLISAWFSDTGGYFAGRALGGPKLYPAVSPNKTWAGAIGGVLTAAVGAVVLKQFFYPPLSWEATLGMVIPGSVLGQLGDLCESLIKRSCGVKDSGSLLPGHGGILDRIDAVLFIAPYFYLFHLLGGLN